MTTATGHTHYVTPAPAILSRVNLQIKHILCACLAFFPLFFDVAHFKESGKHCQKDVSFLSPTKIEDVCTKKKKAIL